jgi:hypothetical protein
VRGGIRRSSCRRLVVLIVSEHVKQALEEEGITGIQFVEV